MQFGTVSAAAPAPINTYDLLARVDWTPNDRDNISVRYIFNDQVVTNQFPTPFEGFAVDVPGRVQNLYGNYTRILSPRMTNGLRFSYGRFNVLFGAQDPAALTFGPQFLFSGASISGVGILGGLTTTFFPQGRVFNNYQLQDTITYTTGAHTIRANGQMRQIAKQLSIQRAGHADLSAGGGFPVRQLRRCIRDAGNVCGNYVWEPGYSSQRISAVVLRQRHQRIKPNQLNPGSHENQDQLNVVDFPAAGFDKPFDARRKQKGDNNNFAPRFSLPTRNT